MTRRRVCRRIISSHHTYSIIIHYVKIKQQIKLGTTGKHDTFDVNVSHQCCDDV